MAAHAFGCTPGLRAAPLYTQECSAGVRPQNLNWGFPGTLARPLVTTPASRRIGSRHRENRLHVRKNGAQRALGESINRLPGFLFRPFIESSIDGEPEGRFFTFPLPT